ncbi:zinc knuckle CX2CX4HX4C containing protein, partial [Tanacetum coccineum]
MKNPRPVPGALVPWAARQKVGDQDVGDDSVRDVSLNLRESVADRIRRIKGVNPYNEAMKQPRQAFRVIRNPSSDYGLSNDEGDGIGVSAHAGKFGLASSFEGFTSSFGELNPKSLTMNPSSGPKIEVAAWSNATPAGVSNDSTTTPTGGANMEAKSRVQLASANEQHVMGDRSKTHVDLVSISLHVPSVPGTANVVDLFGVPLNTLGDIDNLTKDMELGKYEVWSDLPGEKHTRVMDSIWAMWDAFVVENPNTTSGYSLDQSKSNLLESSVKGSTNIDDTIHVDESPFVQSVIVQDMPNSYAGAAGGSKPVPSKSKANFRSLFSENLYEGASFSIPSKVVKTISTRFANTLYGYFIGKRMAFLVVGKIWFGGCSKERTMMNCNSPIILKKWTMNTRLCKDELTSILVWVKIHDVPIQVFSEDGLSIITSQIGKPIMLDSYTSSMCIESWGTSSFARCLIEINADDVLKESLTMGVPLIEGLGFTIETISIEYEWKPPRCDICNIFGHIHDHCPKKVLNPPIVVPPMVTTPTIEKTNDGFQTVGKKKKKGKSKSTNSSVGPLESDIRLKASGTEPNNGDQDVLDNCPSLSRRSTWLDIIWEIRSLSTK